MARPRTKRNKRSYSGLSAQEAFALIGRGRLSAWEIEAPPRAPSPTLIENMRRLNSFMVTASEAGKELLIDALLAEIVPLYSNLRVWKGHALETDTLIGAADYLIAPFLDYLSAPLLCAVEAGCPLGDDDFEAGEIQYLAEMYACRQKNEAESLRIDVYGIVSNGQGWVFYRWNAENTELGRTNLFGLTALPSLLGALDHVCAACNTQILA